MKSTPKEVKINTANASTTFENEIKISYSDNDIIFCDSIRELPEVHSIKLDMILIMACIIGKGQLDINGKPYTVKENEILLCSDYQILSNCMISPDFECKILGLSYNIVQRLLHLGRDVWDKIFYLNQHPLIELTEKELVIFNKYYELVVEKMSQPQHLYYKETMNALVQSAIYELLAHLEHTVSATDTGIMRQGELTFKKFMTLVSEDGGKNRSVGYYAKELCVTPKYLSAICKEQSGKTASEWIQKRAVETIRHLLKNSEKSIKELADELNFPNMSFFGKYVKEHLGMSPSNFRRQKMAE